MKKDFLNLFDYNDWANEKALESFKTTEKIDEKAQLLFSHILISQTIWRERVLGKPQTFKTTMQLLSIDECIKLSRQSTKDWISFIENLNEEKLSSLIEYRNTKGED